MSEPWSPVHVTEPRAVSPRQWACCCSVSASVHFAKLTQPLFQQLLLGCVVVVEVSSSEGRHIVASSSPASGARCHLFTSTLLAFFVSSAFVVVLCRRWLTGVYIRTHAIPLLWWSVLACDRPLDCIFPLEMLSKYTHLLKIKYMIPTCQSCRAL